MNGGASGILQFTWLVAQNGYSIVEEPTPDARNAKIVQCGRGEYRHYHPLEEEPLLFSKFAELDGSDKSILDFANKYGLLEWGAKRRPLNVPIEGSRLYNGKPKQIEPIGKWLEEPKMVATILDIWDYLEHGEYGVLRDRFTWKEGFISYTDPERFPNTSFVISHQYWKNNAFYDLCKPGNVELPAKLFIAQTINERLRQSVSPVISFPNEETLVLRESLQPATLLAAIWLQVMWAVVGQRKIRRCSVCNEWMDVTGNRQNKTVHDTCRKLKYWKDRVEAQRLHDEGFSPEQIAELITTIDGKPRDIEQIRKWIKC